MKTLLTTVCLAGLLASTRIFAAEADSIALQSNDTGRVLLTWDKFKQVTGWDERTMRASRDENRFVVPWNEVQQLLGVEIKDVGTAELKLPWREFKTVLEWSVQENERKRKEKQDDAPMPFLISAASYESGALTKDGAQFTATFKVKVIEQKGWKSIPILPLQVAVSDAQLPTNVFLHQDGSMYVLLTKDPGEFEAKLTFSVAVTEAGGTYSLQFSKVASGSCVLDVTVPRSDVDVNIKEAQSKLAKSTNNATRVVAALPATAAVAISWERAVPEVEKVPPKLYAESCTLISIADGLLLGQAQVSFSILHTATRELTLTVPEGVSILECTGQELRDWRINKNVLTVQLEKEVIGTYSLSIKYEASQTVGSGKVTVPLIYGAGIEREKGHVAVVALANVEIKDGGTTGAHPVDAKDLPPAVVSMTTQPVLLGYRYVGATGAISLQITRHDDVGVLLTVVDKAQFTVMQTFDGRRITRGLFQVRNNRNQFLRLKMPKGTEIWSATVAGRATQPAMDKEGSVLLPLVRSLGQGSMSSFPVELVYAEEGQAPDEKGRGTAKVELPTCSEPIMQLTVSLYVPQEGEYEDFAGTLREVKQFAAIGGPGAPVVVRGDVQAMQQAYVQKQSQVVSTAGSTPIDVQLPMTGKVYLFEKILVLKEAQWFSYAFSGLTREKPGFFGW